MFQAHFRTVIMTGKGAWMSGNIQVFPSGCINRRDTSLRRIGNQLQSFRLGGIFATELLPKPHKNIRTSDDDVLQVLNNVVLSDIIALVRSISNKQIRKTIHYH
jgi:hypothetical protein